MNRRIPICLTPACLTPACLTLICLLAACLRPTTAPSGKAPAAPHPGRAAFERGYGLILQGDLKAGLAVLGPIPPDSLGPADRASRQAILDRFQTGPAREPNLPVGFPRAVVASYEDYWTQSLLRRVAPGTAEAGLQTRLRACLRQHGKPADGYRTLEDLTEALGPLLEAEGFHSLRGLTAPYHELMLWRKERAATYEVRLPDSMQRVRVVFMSDFVLRGWLGFATCDRSYSGGWTTDQALFCLEDAYDLDSEGFTVSYLAHEGQHFADNQRFPKLQQPELEYRAKLVEVIQAKATLPALLDQFSRRGGTQRDAPHAYANRQLALNLSLALFGGDAAMKDPGRWAEKAPADIQAAALRLLRESTAALEASGADKAERLPFRD